MQTISATVGYVAANDQAVAASQNVVAAGSMTLAASPVTLAYPSQIVITTSANYSAVNFTVVGTDANGVVTTEIVTGPNATTKNLTNYFKTITSISTDGGVGGGAVKVGTTGQTSSRWLALDSWASPVTSVQIDITSATVTLQTTLDNPNDPQAPVAAINVNWLSDSNFTNKSSTLNGSFTSSPNLVRLIQTSGTGSATVKLAQFSSVPY